MKTNITNCICGRAPKFISRDIAFNTPYIMLECLCGIGTFATKKKEFCTELWEATIKYMKKKDLNKNKGKQDD